MDGVSTKKTLIMAQQPDKLFRDKLRGYQKETPHGAWNRVAENLQRERKTYPWMRIAAAVLLMAVAFALLVPFWRETPPVNIAQQKESSAPAKNTQPTPANEIEQTPKEARTETEPPREMPKENSASRHAPVQKKNVPDVRALPEAEKKQLFAVPDQNATLANAPDVAPNDSVSEQLHEAGDAGLASAPAPSRHVTIVFSAEEVNEKYLDKKEMADATPESKAASSLRKLLDKAYALKHNQDPLGEIRQKKNEILAFNFKDDKPQHD